jgi:hypothetical protein
MTTDVKPQDNRAAGAVVATASVAALACGVCCVLPLALPAVMLGSFGGIISRFSDAYSWMTPVAIVAVIVGWLWVAYQSKRSGKLPAGSTLFIMAFATLMMVLAYMWPAYEGTIASLLPR